MQNKLENLKMSTNIQHEIYVARYYQNNVQNARKSGYELKHLLKMASKINKLDIV